MLFKQKRANLYNKFSLRQVPKIREGHSVLYLKKAVDIARKGDGVVSRVTLRRKSINKGKASLYLDIYPPARRPDTGKLVRKHYLKIFVYLKPKTELERFHNRETMELAIHLAAKRQIHCLPCGLM